MAIALTSCTAKPAKQQPISAPTSTPIITVQPTEQPISELTVHFIDVGQADAALLQCDDIVLKNIIEGGIKTSLFHCA